MHCFRKVTEDLYWVGANDRRIELFENIFPLSDGVSYNSYLLLDEKTVLFDSADYSIGRQFLENVQAVLDGRSLEESGKIGLGAGAVAVEAETTINPEMCIEKALAKGGLKR